MFVARALPRCGAQSVRASASAVGRAGRVQVASLLTRPTTRPQARWSSTSTPGPRTWTSAISTPRLLLVALLSGLLGYTLAGPASSEASGSKSGHITFNSQYGSVDDFQKAVKELRELFTEEGAVSTDQEVLARHGKSFGIAKDGAQIMLRFLGDGLTASA